MLLRYDAVHIFCNHLLSLISKSSRFVGTNVYARQSHQTAKPGITHTMTFFSSHRAQDLALLNCVYGIHTYIYNIDTYIYGSEEFDGLMNT